MGIKTKAKTETTGDAAGWPFKGRAEAQRKALKLILSRHEETKAESLDDSQLDFVSATIDALKSNNAADWQEVAAKLLKLEDKAKMPLAVRGAIHAFCDSTDSMQFNGMSMAWYNIHKAVRRICDGEGWDAAWQIIYEIKYK